MLQSAIENWGSQNLLSKRGQPELKRRHSEKFTKEDLANATVEVIRRRDEVFELSQEETEICENSSKLHAKSMKGWENSVAGKRRMETDSEALMREVNKDNISKIIKYLFNSNLILVIYGIPILKCTNKVCLKIIRYLHYSMKIITCLRFLCLTKHFNISKGYLNFKTYLQIVNWCQFSKFSLNYFIRFFQ